ncbi:MAG: flap endonuclease [Gammaproteobacteria bacterium]|nr:MAG: flap endonuclease [Gammaproteobacteria bacterium]
MDSSMYIFRAWHSLDESIVDAEGHPANAVYGFTDFVYRFLSDVQPQHVAFAFDKSLTSCFRNELYPPYKANRPPAPQELLVQFRYCREFIDALGIVELGSQMYEADDIIGTLAVRARNNGLAAVILTGDKDMAQLLKLERDVLWDYAKNRRLDCQGVEQHFGVRPEQIADLLAIAGDQSDNIPGVPGLGNKTAVELLLRFRDVEELLEKKDVIEFLKIRGAERTQRLVQAHEDDIRLFRKITEIKVDVDLPHMELRPRGPDHLALEDLFERLGFSQFRRERWVVLAEGLAESVN